ncbi:hypothetical protein [Roseibium algae]|uniref:Uncharacterized protein n=1 Tax=Roseibium algae TaxID=3123038 RepID=A0ABU8TLI0_9HYPH
MSLAHQHLSRRTVLKTGMVAGFGLSSVLAGVSGISAAVTSGVLIGGTRMDTLISALNNIGNPVCLAAANRLAALDPNSISFDLNLRRAGMDAGNARVLADALHETNGSSRPVLRSFSAS